MRIAKLLPSPARTLYTCELTECPRCDADLEIAPHVTGLKTVQTLTGVVRVGYRPKVCVEDACAVAGYFLPSVTWAGVAPKYSTYGYDVIAQIGWSRQKEYQRFEKTHMSLAAQIQISESQVRYLYHQQYLPLLACQERQHLPALRALAETHGLLLGLDGLVVEGGEPQLWVVRELQTGRTLRAGWLSCEDEAAFTAFLQPLAEWAPWVRAVLSDKQRGLVPAVQTIFPQAKYAFCQTHYFKNAAEPVAAADEQLKLALRQAVRAEVGEVIRQKNAENPVPLTVTGLLPSPLPAATAAPTPAAERETLVQDLLHRVRYLLTLKGRAPFRLAGVEMYARLQEVARGLDELLRHQSEPRLERLRTGLRHALQTVRADYAEVHQAADWLEEVAAVLDPEQHPVRTGREVQAEWRACLARIEADAATSPRLQAWSAAIHRVSESYAAGLFHTYDLPGLPRTNNARESEFRDVRRRLLATTGQVGATKRLLHREGAWELIPGLPSLAETIEAFSGVDPRELQQERARVRAHRNRFRLDTRSASQAQAQLKKIVARWKALPLEGIPE